MRLIILGLLALCVTAMAEEKNSIWNFDADEAGAIAKGFSNETGAWKVAKDESAPSKASVLAQTAKSATKVFNIALVSAASYQNLDLSVKFKAVAGEIDQGGGLVWRARDAKNYYVVRFNPLENNLRLYKVAAGVRTQLQNADVTLPEGWQTLRVVMAGNKIECYLNGQKQIEAQDETFKDAGKIGLWTKADAQTHFDDLSAAAK